MVNAAVDFFFYVIQWVFNDFLLKIKIFNIPILYFFLVLGISSILIFSLINKSKASVINSVKSNKRKGK